MQALPAVLTVLAPTPFDMKPRGKLAPRSMGLVLEFCGLLPAPCVLRCAAPKSAPTPDDVSP